MDDVCSRDDAFKSGGGSRMFASTRSAFIETKKKKNKKISDIGLGATTRLHIPSLCGMPKEVRHRDHEELRRPHYMY